jgi:hypothetical protein
MPEFEPMMIVCLVLMGVLLINAGLVLVLSHPDTRNQVTIFRKAFRGLRDPWASEDQALDDLHSSVTMLEENERGPNADDAE